MDLAESKIEYQVLIRWSVGVTPDQKAAIKAAEQLSEGGDPFGVLESYKTISELPVRTIQSRLIGYPQIADASVLAPPKAHYVPTDNLYSLQWDMKQMGLERAWDITRGSASVRVAIIDTGIQENHAEFSGGRIVDGYDFISDSTNAGDGSGRDSTPTDETDTSVPGKNSHGTHVAGTIGANAGNGGVVGVDHTCKIMPIRALGINGKGSILDIYAGMIYAADLQDADLVGYSWFPTLYPAGLGAARPRPTQAAHVINMSLGSPFDRIAAAAPIQVYNDLVSAIIAKGITVVVAAGNEASAISTPSSITMPAGAPGAICVSATDPTLNDAEYSNYGNEVTVCAPGGETRSESAWLAGSPLSGGILSTDKDVGSGGYWWLQGTSMASPHVAGVCALMKAVNPGLSPAQIKTILQNTAYDLGSVGFDQLFGYGYVMADRAVYAAAGTAPAIQLVAYTGGLNYEPGISTQSFALRNNGGTYAALGTITYSVAYGPGATGWISGLSSTPNGTDAATIGVNISRIGISDGPYSATLTMISTNGGSLNIPVSLKVLATPPSPSFTNVYVLLINWDTDAVVAQRDLVLPNRLFTFTNVPPGTYYICAGTDENNDDIIDDAGEHFGFYQLNPDAIEFSISAGQTKSSVAIPLTLVVNPSG
jgi:serine protease